MKFNIVCLCAAQKSFEIKIQTFSRTFDQSSVTEHSANKSKCWHISNMEMIFL